MKLNKVKVFKTLIVILIFALLFLAIFLPLNLSGALDKINSAEELKEIILQGGVYSYLIFFAIQFLQVVLLPIPAAVTTIAGTLVFGPWITSLISIVAVILASLLSFFIGRKIGRKIVVWIVGEEDTIKWQQRLEKGKFVFFLMMIFPLFPDDILCLVVGATTNISYTFFIVTNLITRPIGIILTCFLGSGSIIPYNTVGFIIWGVLIALMMVLFYLSIKFQPQIENFIFKISSKLSKNKKINSDNTNFSDK